MTNFWLLPFGMIAFWLGAGVIELIRTPKATVTRSNNFGSRVPAN